MDKELMEKINEVLKANGKRELNPDELDQVVGGSFSYNKSTGMCVVEGVEMSGAEFSNLLYGIAGNYGFDMAVTTLYKITGFWCDEMHSANKATGNQGINEMRAVLDLFWGSL